MTAPDDYVDNYNSKVNAPTVMQEVSGDFTVEVNVVYLEKALPNTVHESLESFPTAYHSGTLLIRHDRENFVRFERVSMNTRGNANSHCALHVYKDQNRESLKTENIKDAPTRLRLERRGKQVTAAFSQDDGKTWKSFPPQDIGHLPDDVKVGVSLTSNTQIGGTVKFKGLKIEKAKKN
jgi:regulation of enolase protein 1 (concanavalin A-like superfamily)